MIQQDSQLPLRIFYFPLLIILAIFAYQPFQHAEAIIGYGILLNNLGRYAESEIQFKRALEIDPKNAFGYFQYSILLLKQGGVVESYEKLKQAVETEPKVREIFSRLVYNLVESCTDFLRRHCAIDKL